MTKEQKLKLIYRHMHRDYKGKIGGCGAVLVLREGSTTLVMMTALTDAEIACFPPQYARKPSGWTTRQNRRSDLKAHRPGLAPRPALPPRHTPTPERT